MLHDTFAGTARIRHWNPTPVEHFVADAADELAHLVNGAERTLKSLPRQLVHGDYWDNNVLFREGRIVQVADLDFMGERARIDDVALTLYYINATCSGDPLSAERARQFRALTDAYDSGLDDYLTPDERAAIPLAIARTPLCFIAQVAAPEYDLAARPWLTAEMPRNLGWALAIATDLARWQSAFA